jgi:tripartite-type tricarboxylate transporter receptor subunit TctC
MALAKTLSCVVLAWLALASAHAQVASDYPNRPIRLIVPVGPGAGLDTAARVSAEAVEKHLGQRIVVENKPGAGQRIGAALAAKAAPDGYTLLFTTPTPIAVAEHFSQKLDFEPAKDFRPVAIAIYQPVMLIVRPSLGVKTVAEFIAYAKANPGKISFGVQGLGGEMHLSLEHFKKLAGVSITPVPYNAANRRSSTCSATGSTPCSWSFRRSRATSRAASCLRSPRSTPSASKPSRTCRRWPRSAYRR